MLKKILLGALISTTMLIGSAFSAPLIQYDEGGRYQNIFGIIDGEWYTMNIYSNGGWDRVTTPGYAAQLDRDYPRAREYEAAAQMRENRETEEMEAPAPAMDDEEVTVYRGVHDVTFGTDTYRIFYASTEENCGTNVAGTCSVSWLLNNEKLILKGDGGLGTESTKIDVVKSIAEAAKTKWEKAVESVPVQNQEAVQASRDRADAVVEAVKLDLDIVDEISPGATEAIEAIKVETTSHPITGASINLLDAIDPGRTNDALAALIYRNRCSGSTEPGVCGNPAN